MDHTTSITTSHFGMSTTIGAFAKALVAAQRKLGHAPKERENTFFKSSYADLATVIDTIKDVIAEAGIARFQGLLGDGDVVGVRTVLIHAESGEWVWAEAFCRPAKNDPQGAGSAWTYLRRYTLSAAVGIAQEDDDANAASKPHLVAGQAGSPSTDHPHQAHHSASKMVRVDPNENERVKAIATSREIIAKLGWTVPEVVTQIKRLCSGKERLADLDLAEVTLFEAFVRDALAKKDAAA